MTEKRGLQTELKFSLDDWVLDELRNWSSVIPEAEAQMDLAIRLSSLNIEHGGGPFGAIVVDQIGNLVSVGVNLVLPYSVSVLHAEVVAITLAQRRVGSFTLKSQNGAKHRLVSSATPCVACFGCLWWSGATELLTGARKADVQAITKIDEGPINPNWRESLTESGITVIEDIRREQSCAVLKQYSQQNGIIYNA
jgi:tRNA(Arg) A34 adenosine deaminase TadA